MTQRGLRTPAFTVCARWRLARSGFGRSKQYANLTKRNRHFGVGKEETGFGRGEFSEEVRLRQEGGLGLPPAAERPRSSASGHVGQRHATVCGEGRREVRQN